MRLNLENDYAFRIILAFCNSPRGEKFRSADLSKNLHIPERFTYRILRKLLLSGIIESIRGPRGGYILTKEPDEITLYDAYTAISGELKINACIGEEICDTMSEACAMHSELMRIQTLIKKEFESVTFGEILDKYPHK